ncbi:fasciclin domain-containing protein [Candidatus Poriferisodalis sp.]|uniref:fasciclin domain-containing protein n=1 Tax=Candidatus Poriferisodalis sp. TaxID=3101277 RepID=UPI003B025B49
MLALVLLAAACGADDNDADAPAAPTATAAPTSAGEAPMAEEDMSAGTIVEVAVASGQFPTLVAAVQAAGLVEVLSGDGPFTVLAPTEEAFAAALAALDMTAEDLLADTELLTAVLTYHVLPLEAPAEVVVTLDGQSVATVNGAEIVISVDGDTVMINDATVVATDIAASNGIIHVIDTVLVPPSVTGGASAAATDQETMAEDEAAIAGTIVEVAVSSGQFPTLVAAVQAAGLVDVLSGEGPFTVLAPTEEAFAAALAALDMAPAELLANTELLTAVLTYHVLPLEAPAAAVATLDGQLVATVNGAEVAVAVDGNTVMINDATVVATDIAASNGIIHVIDTVLIPPAVIETLSSTAPEEMMPGTIVEVAVSSGQFPTLVAAVQAAGLVEVLSGEGPFTVLAPTEEAFAAALAALDIAPADLLANTELLTAVLTYHVLPLEAPAEVVVGLDGQSVATVNGEEIAISVDGDTVMINDATVVATDIAASNGIIHVIDTVLVPPSVIEALSSAAQE